MNGWIARRPLLLFSFFFFELLLVWRGVAVACMTRHGRGMRRHVGMSPSLAVSMSECNTSTDQSLTTQNEMESSDLFLLSHTHHTFTKGYLLNLERKEAFFGVFLWQLVIDGMIG
jgi:hypothetical protein